MKPSPNELVGMVISREGLLKKLIMKLSELDKYYIAGFLDGDGCINAQIVKRSDYKLKFQIRVYVSFFQKTKHWGHV